MPQLIDKALIVDGDESMRNLVSRYLEAMGVWNRHKFANGNEAWSYLLVEPVDLIVLEWKMTGLAGVTLLNKIRRQEKLATVPVVVISGAVDKEDMRLIREFPATYFLGKPFQQVKFDAQLKQVFEDQQYVKKHQETIETVFQFCGEDGDRALSDCLRLMKDAPNPVPLALLFGKRMHAAGFVVQAKTVYRQLLDLDHQCLTAMNELARILKDEGHFDEALQYLTKAHKLAPKNIDRLCLLGETEINLSHPDKAIAYYEKALAIDKTDKRAGEGMTVLKNLEEYLAKSPEVDTSRNLASLLNNTGIAMVHAGKFQDGLKHYTITLGLLNQKDLKARVCFNVGIGFLRWSKPREALDWFAHSATLDKKPGNKSHRYVQMLKPRFAGEKAAGPRWTKGEVKAIDSIDYSELEQTEVSATDLAADLNGAGLSVEEDPFQEESLLGDYKKT